MPDQIAFAAPNDGLITVETAISALRRGLPAYLGTEAPLALLAVETADDAGLQGFARAAAGPGTLLLSPARGERLFGQVSATPVALDAAGMTIETMRRLADPTLPPANISPVATRVPEAAAVALRLAVLARLLPALLVAPAPGRVGVAEANVLSYAALAAAAVERVSEASVPLEDVADARLVAFRTAGSGLEHYAVLIGRPEDVAEPLVRVHSECFTGDLLGSLRCDCGPQLRGAIRRIAAEGAGAVLYMGQEGRGIGLPNKLRAYTLQDGGLDTLDANLALGFAADERDFLTAAAMLRQLGLMRIRLLTNNPDKLAVLAAHGIEVAGRASLLYAANGVNDKYLDTKATRFGHLPG